MPDHDRDLEQGPRAPYPAGQRTAAMTARPDEHRHQIGQLATRELDLYGSQLARCLKALGTDAPIRADVQRELATVRAEQDSRARAAEPRDPATAARHADARDRQTGHLRAELARIDTAERALISELERGTAKISPKGAVGGLTAGRGPRPSSPPRVRSPKELVVLCSR